MFLQARLWTVLLKEQELFGIDGPMTLPESQTYGAPKSSSMPKIIKISVVQINMCIVRILAEKELYILERNPMLAVMILPLINIIIILILPFTHHLYVLQIKTSLSYY